MLHVYVTWAGVICLICIHKPKGAQRLRHIRQIMIVYVTYVM